MAERNWKELSGAVLIRFSLGVLLFIAGCARTQPRAELVILNSAEPESLDPAIVTAQPDMRVASALFEGLTRSDPKTGLPVPSLAERWDISSDGCIYTFHLRKNLAWSTSEPITSADVLYSWLRALAPATASDYAGQLFYLKNAEEFNRGDFKDPARVGIQALDALTVRVELKSPTPFFPDLCALPILAIVPRQTIERWGDRWLKAQPLPVSGAYCLRAWRINDKVSIIKNPRYWDAANTQNNTVDILPIGSPQMALNLYETGAADLVLDKELVPSELIDELLKRPDFHAFDYLATYFIRFNVTKKPFSDVRVRQALALCIDKKRLVQKITKAGEKPASHLTPPGLPHYHPPEGLGYDPAAARRLLAAAGYPDGQRFPSVQYMFNAAAGGSAKTHQKIGVELQQMWQQELGIRVELRQVENKVLMASQSGLDYDVCRSSWVGDYADPNTFLDLFLSASGNNRTGWKNPHYDDLMHRANRELNALAREKILQEAELLLVREEMPIVPLFFYVGICYYHPDQLEGVYPNLVDQHPINAIRK